MISKGLADTLPSQRAVAFDRLVRDSAFAYRCHACQRCCQDKLIRVNPFEVLQLSRATGLSTTAFLARHVDRETSFLRISGEGRCAFLDGWLGCSVHGHRPLVCRLYPLGRHLSGEGVETFSNLQPHPLSEGVYSNDGSVDDYLASQQAAPYIDAADRLLAVFHALYCRDSAATGDSTIDADATDDGTDWLDVDQVIERVAGLPVDRSPAGANAMFDVYLDAIRASIACYAGEPHEPQTSARP